MDTPSTLINPASRHDPNLTWFREARLGLFIHFGLSSALGVSEHLQFAKRIPSQEYEAMATRFNPQRFSAAHWVDAAEALGARYLTLVCKHHDGFCLWDTSTTDFKVTNTPFKRDLVREVSDECRRRGIRFVSYCSQPDWHARSYAWLSGSWGDRQWHTPDEKPNWEAYIAYLKTQLTELFRDYGSQGNWFDGCSFTERRWHGRELYALIKDICPQAAVNDRAGYGDYLSPEWQLDETVPFQQYLVEQCISVANSGWAYNKDSDWRSAAECVDILIRMAGCGSNLLLNIGPTGDGTIHPDCLERLAAVGTWLKVNGEAVYASEGLRLNGLDPAMRATRKGNDLYLFLRTWPRTDRLRLPAVLDMPARATLLGHGPLQVSADGQGWRLDGLPALPSDPMAKVIKLSFAAAPRLLGPQPPARIETVRTVGACQPNVLSARDASCCGFRVKYFRHKVTRLSGADAAMGQALPELGWDSPATRLSRNNSNIDQAIMWAMSDNDDRQAICDWRGVDQRIVFHLETDAAFRARIDLLLRVPDGFGGSRIALRCGSSAGEHRVQGNPGVAAELANSPDWWQGWSRLPFQWEEGPVLTVPAGRSCLELQPIEIPYGCFLADLAGLRLMPV